MKKEYNERGHIVIKNFSLYLQIIIMFLIIIFGIMYFWIPEFLLIVQLLVVAFLFISAYINYKIYNRKNISIVYFICSIAFLISTLLDFFGK